MREGRERVQRGREDGERGERERGSREGGGETGVREEESMRKGWRGQEKEVMICYVRFYCVFFHTHVSDNQCFIKSIQS